MARAKRSRPASRAPGAPAAAGSRPDVYALVLHGIGVRNPDRFARESIDRIVSQLVADGGWESTGCDEGCGHATGHAHLRTGDGSRQQTLIVDPYYWGHQVPPRSIVVVVWWMMRATFALAVLQVTTPVLRFARFATRLDDARRLAQAGGAAYLLLLMIAGPFVLLARIVLLLAAALIGVTVVVLVPPLWSYARDAFSWCSIDDFRDEVIAGCETRVSAAGARRVLLVGHSQGGSILTEFALGRPASFARRARLVTFGSGQAILATLRRAQTVDASMILLIFLVILLYVLTAVGLLAPATKDLLDALATGVTQAGVVASSLWLAPVGDPHAVAATFSGLARDSLSRWLDAVTTITPLLPGWAFLALPVLNAAMFLIVRYSVLPLGRQIAERARPSIGGADVVASCDVVATPLRQLGAPDRVVFVRQTCSFLLDHVTYYRNGVTGLPQITAALDALTGRAEERPARGPRAELDREHAVRTRGARAGTVLLAAALGTVIGSWLAPAFASALAVLVVAVVAGMIVAEQMSAIRLQEDSWLTSSGGLAVAAASRRRRRSRLWATALLATAFSCLLVLIGVSQSSPATWTSPANLAVARAHSADLFGAALLCLVAAWLFLRGSRAARLLGLAAWAGFGAVFLTFGQTRLWVPVLCVVLGAVTFLWPRRRIRSVSAVSLTPPVAEAVIAAE